jgi:hypothetical protein
MIALALALLLSQTETPAPTPEKPAPKAAESERETQRRIADAAERLANAAERMFPAPKAEAAAPAPPSAWSGSVSSGLTWVTGNVTSISFLFNGAVSRKTDQTIFAAKAFAGYGQRLDDVMGVYEVLMFNAGAAAQFDWRFNSTVSAFLGAGIDTDHVKSVELRGYGELGAGVTWFDQKEGELQKVLLKTDLSFRAQPESRFQYYPTLAQVDDTFLLGPRVAGVFRYSLTKATYFHQELEVLPNVLGLRFLINSLSKVSVGIASALSLTASFTVRYDSAPAIGKKPVDTVLAIGIEANF